MTVFNPLAFSSAIVAALSAACVLAPVPARAQLYTTYNFDNAGFNWVTCGSTPQSEGCYGSGAVTTFGHLCAIFEDYASGTTYDYKQHVYALDNNATGKKDVVLHILTLSISTDQTGFAHTTFTPLTNVKLPLTGGNGVKCYAAENGAAIVAGTNASTQAAYIDRKTLAVSGYGGFSPPATVSGITVDAAGYITVNFQGGFYLIGPDGSGQEDGGGNAYLIPRGNALTR
jgi:hypothetical protein